MPDADEPTPLQRAWPVGTPVVWLRTGPTGDLAIPAVVLTTNSYAGTVKVGARGYRGKAVERWVRPERLRRGASEF